MLKEFFRALMRPQEASGAHLDRARAWEIAPPQTLGNLAVAFRQILSSDSILALEATRFDPEVESLLQPHQVPPQLDIQPGTQFPVSKWLHLRATDSVLHIIGELATTFAGPEVCNHLYAYRHQELVLEWDDVFVGRIYIASQITESAVAAFCATLGTRVLKTPDASSPW